MEVLQDAKTQQDLIDWLGKLDYFVARTEPSNLLEIHYEKTEIINPMCVFVIVDLRNMQVLESNCGQCHDLMAEQCIEEALDLL